MEFYSDPTEELRSDPDKINDGIYFVGFYGTPKVLEYIGEHPQCERKELHHLVEGITVTTLVEKLQRTGLIDKELTLTEKGRTLLKCLQTLRNMLEE